MDRVQKTFVIIQYVEVAAIVIATIIALAFKNQIEISGITLAFVLNSAILLAFDIIAERRGERYLSKIKTQASRA